MATKAKLQMKDKRSGLLIGPDTEIIIRDTADALKAVKAAGELQQEISEIRVEHELDVLEADYEKYRKSLRDFQKENELDEISSGGFVSGLVNRTKSFWVWRLADIPENITLDDDIVPLQNVVKKRYRKLKERTKITAKITKRVVMPSALDDAVKAGLFTAEDIQNSLAEYIETSYVQIKPSKPK